MLKINLQPDFIDSDIKSVTMHCLSSLNYLPYLLPHFQCSECSELSFCASGVSSGLPPNSYICYCEASNCRMKENWTAINT